MTDVKKLADRLMANIERVIVGKRSSIALSLVALFGEGHILVEDVPGVGKTMLARALAASLGATFSRIQCTPDLLPTDVTGSNVFNQKTSQFEFHPGPILKQIVLADEINRATPRTQSALLECMAEGQVTVDGVTYKTPNPFILFATQNPIEHEGTFPLPEAQMDRFLVKLAMGYPEYIDELEMLRRLQKTHPIFSLETVAEAAEIVAAQESVREISVSDPVREYVLRIVSATRKDDALDLGASPRASLYLVRTAQALAAMKGRDYVIPDDVKALVRAVLEHRIILKPEARLRKMTSAIVLTRVIEATPAPVAEK